MRKVPVSRLRTPRTPEQPPIYTWAFKSSQPRAGGMVIDYITQLNANETLSCNCPGWIFARKGQARGCTHTRQVEHEVPAILRSYRSGERLPILTESAEKTGFTTPPVPNGTRGASSNDNSRIRYGRVIEL